MSVKTPIIPPKKITKKAIAALNPKDAPFVLWDTEIKGFGVKVLASGQKSYVVQFRMGKGRGARIFKKRIDSVGATSLEKARERARVWRDAAAKGIDPVAVQQEEGKRTFAKLAEDYLERHARVKKERTAHEDDLKLKHKQIRRLNSKLVASITHEDIEIIHHALRKTPYHANRCIALLSKMFSLAVKWGWRSDNPVKGIERYREDPRERYLDFAEMAQLADALDAYVTETHKKFPKKDSAYRREGELAVYAIRMLMLTGARRMEVLSASWDMFDFEDGVWIKPSSHTKQKKTHRAPLSPSALQLLQEMRSAAPEGEKYIFPSWRSASGHMVELNKPWRIIKKAAEIEDVRIHDLRHSFASLLASGGVSLPIIGALLGHTQPATTARYAHLFDDPLREAASKVGAAYEAAKKGTTGEVHQLRGDRGNG